MVHCHIPVAMQVHPLFALLALVVPTWTQPPERQTIAPMPHHFLAVFPRAFSLQSNALGYHEYPRYNVVQVP
jgi:hypothetical protein